MPVVQLEVGVRLVREVGDADGKRIGAVPCAGLAVFRLELGPGVEIAHEPVDVLAADVEHAHGHPHARQAVGEEENDDAVEGVDVPAHVAILIIDPGPVDRDEKAHDALDEREDGKPAEEALERRGDVDLPALRERGLADRQAHGDERADHRGHNAPVSLAPHAGVVP